MKRIFKFAGDLAWSLTLLFGMLILGYTVLSFVKHQFGGNAVGSVAGEIEHLASPR